MSPIVATILSLCLFETAPLPSGDAVHRVTLLGYKLGGQVLDLEEILEHAERAPSGGEVREEHVGGLDVADAVDDAPVAEAVIAEESLPADTSDVEELQRASDHAAELDCDVKVRACLDCDMGRLPGDCERCGGRGIRVWSSDVEVGPGWMPRHPAEYIAIAAALGERRQSLSTQADAGAGELLRQILRRAPAGHRARATAWWDSGSMVEDASDDIDVIADANPEAEPTAPVAEIVVELDAEAPAPEAPAPERTVEPSVHAAAALCTGCNGGRRCHRAECTRCQARGVRVWVDQREVAVRLTWKPGSDAERLAIVAALADLQPELPAEAMRGALDLLNVTLRETDEATRTRALALWTAGGVQIGAAT